MPRSQKNIHTLAGQVKAVEGWLNPMEQIALLHMPLMVDHVEGALVEIGSFKGKSTVALALGSSLMSMRKRPVHAIDPFGLYMKQSYYGTFMENVKKNGVTDYVIPIRKYSTEAYEECPRQIALLFIDGDHAYESVKHDITHYAPRVVPGGVLAFHDYGTGWPGVTQAVNELCPPGLYEHLCDYDSLRVYRKR